MFTILKIVVFAIYLVVTTGFPAIIDEGTENSSETTTLRYLTKFGYLPPVDPTNPDKIVTNDQLAKAIRDFQQFMGLEVTGELDEETKEEMKKSRCGIKDKSPPSTNRRFKRYNLAEGKWDHNNITYKVVKYPSKFPRDETDKAFRDAFNVWARHIPLTFTRVTTGPVDIEIRFLGEDETNEGNPEIKFDGPGAEMAKTYYPKDTSPKGGDMYFDDDEEWTYNTTRGVNLFQMAAHEIGHALGLGHSSVRESLMYPAVKTYKPNLDLHRDDIEGIQKLYPRKEEEDGLVVHLTIHKTQSGRIL
ncbi:matrix metalloproteinase-19-like [Macrosteles quadrilineatus]|uniref:matrix metalloproteinase-19-like n=1 Tax=Macrosteles quadrilineatus TaxID=74068 RepID=UPI0023E18295|nr:matrix metalloproteinase-19-like [Macrosteles quadrilineatus]